MHGPLPAPSPNLVAAFPHENVGTTADGGRAELEARTIEAHREFLLALVDLERREHEWERVVAGYDSNERSCVSAEACAEAESHKDRCYHVFIELAATLGFFPSGHGIKLPRKPYVRQRRA